MIPVIVDKHEGNVFFYATEYKGEMDLFDYIKHYISKTEPDINLIYQIFLDVCQAVKYIHSKNVIHRDLKLDNIIIQPKTHQILLIDWGLAEKKPYSNAMCGSYDFVAPEVVALNVAERYTGPSNDIWALGVIFIGMITGLMPWTAIEHSEIIKQIRTFNIYYPETLTKDQITFLRHIFVDHKRRYTIDDIINHDLFKITS
jgi:serine/threonine protein kinase